MKHKLFSVLSAILLSCSMLIAGNTDPGDIPLDPNDPNKNNPRAPLPTCSYDGQWLTIDFAISEGLASIEIDDGINIDLHNNYSTAAPILINVGTLAPGTTITIVTQQGNTYTGYYL